ncbi:MAG: trypsin-like peptidase domain-containing protein, partial [Planctomycetota bacterium]|nr:trypsin-like peptidase domain-containing protein [Planctomycetota bacterium]
MKNFPWILYLVTVLSAQPLWADLDADLQDAFQKAVESVAPSVVMIETAGGVDKVGKVLKGQGPTTGVVISPEGYIATSAFNFVHKPSSILVTLKDDKRYPAKLVASDLTRQITVLKIDAKLQTSPAAPLSELKVGHWSLALGRTWGGELPAMSVGIISALHRVWGKAVQTDAKVSPANYGGPLIDI